MDAGRSPPTAVESDVTLPTEIVPPGSMAVRPADWHGAQKLPPGAEMPAEIVSLAEQGQLPALALPPSRDDETPLQFERFTHWLLAPLRGERRSWTATGRAFGCDESVIRSIGDSKAWIERSIAWDRQRTLKAARQVAELQAEAAVSHVTLAQDLTDQAQLVVRQCSEMLEGPMSLDVIESWTKAAGQCARVLEKAQKVARLALGQSDSNSSIHVKVEAASTEQVDREKLLARMSLAELDTYCFAEQAMNEIRDKILDAPERDRRMPMAHRIAAALGIALPTDDTSEAA